MAIRFRSVLVASDLKAGSDMAVSAAGRLAAACGAELHALHSLDIRALNGAATRTLQEDMAHAEHALDEQLLRTIPADTRPGSRAVVLSLAHAAILQQARDLAADLVVLGRHQGAAAGDLGTTADHVVRHAGVPCLVVNTPLSLPLERVVVAYDFSEAAEAALAEALAWTAWFGASHPDVTPPELVVFHVIRPLDPLGEYFASMDDMSELLDRHIAEARDARSTGTRVGLEARGHVLWSDPADDAIATYATDADLLVLGTRGAGTSRRGFLGSVASSVARRAACPVLLAPHAHAPERKGTESPLVAALANGRLGVPGAGNGRSGPFTP